MKYNIILTDQNGAEAKIRMTLPFFAQNADTTNSRWHAEGGKLKISNGTCQALSGSGAGNLIFSLNVQLVAMGAYGVTLFNFFSGETMTHNQGGTAQIESGWGGSSLIPGPAGWTIDD